MQTLFSDLLAAQLLRLCANVSFDDKKLEAKYLSEIADLERLNRRSNVEELRPMLKFRLGTCAYLTRQVTPTFTR